MNGTPKFILCFFFFFKKKIEREINPKEKRIWNELL